MKILITNCRRAPKWESVQQILCECLNHNVKIINVQRRDNRCDYRGIGEYDIKVERDVETILNIELSIEGQSPSFDINLLLIKFRQKFPKVWFKPGVEFDNNPKRVLWSGESSIIDSLPAFSPLFCTDEIYEMGVHRELVEFSSLYKLYWEAYDSGTYFAYLKE